MTMIFSSAIVKLRSAMISGSHAHHFRYGVLSNSNSFSISTRHQQTKHVLSNPLLSLSSAALPSFDNIAPAHFDVAMDKILHEWKSNFTTLELALAEKLQAPKTLHWLEVMVPLQNLNGKLEQVWGLLNHLMSVQNSAELRAVHASWQPKVVKETLGQSQSQVLFQVYQQLLLTSNVTPTQRRILEQAIRGMENSGVGLGEEPRSKLNAVQVELGSLTTTFMNNVLDSTKACKFVITDRKELEGCPASFFELTAESPETVETGPWTVTLDGPCLVPVLTYCSNRELREKLYRAHVTKASSFTPEFNNEPVLRKILSLRQTKAELLDQPSYAHLSLKSKMAQAPDRVSGFLEDLHAKCLDQAREEIVSLAAYAKAEGHDGGALEPWDVAFWSEQRRESLFCFTDEQLRPYFPFSKVLSGLFQLTESIFDVVIEPASTSTWHPDVSFYHVNEKKTGEHLASFYLDPYSRPENKNGGAWMNSARSRSTIDFPETQEDYRRPVAYLICNQSPPGGSTSECLLTFREVETLFHEFGHGLQHMLTKVNESQASGINGIEWDAVEFPSQFMEGFCYDPKVMATMTGHIKTGEPLPHDIFQQLCSARKYMAASGLLRQLYFSMLDLQLHEHTSSRSVEEIQEALVPDYTVIPPLATDRFLCSFSHIFAGGYAAGYYSYKWAEVLAADAFEAFEEQDGEQGEEKKKELGLRFRNTVLALGGSCDPTDVFQQFRGRQPSILPLCRQYGIK